MTKDISPYVLAVAGILVALYFFNQNNELKAQINSCQLEYQGFKQGVLHAK